MLKMLFEKYPGRFGFSVSREFLLLFSPFLSLCGGGRGLIGDGDGIGEGEVGGFPWLEDDVWMPIDFATDTTRAPRGAEQDGVDYFFTTVPKFEEMIKEGGFIEHAKFGSNYYGTSFKAVESIEEKGQVCVLDIEMEVSSLPPSDFYCSSLHLEALLKGELN